MLEILAICVSVTIILFLITLARAPVNDDALCYNDNDGARNPHKWGYEDTRFEFDGPRAVRVTGDRYPIAGYSMPHFVDFVEKVLGVTIRPEDAMVEAVPDSVSLPVENNAFLQALQETLGADQISQDDSDRLVHSHGQLSVDEVYRLLHGDTLERIIDLVLYPEKEEEVSSIICLANTHGACLVPYGGGTNVSGALVCATTEQRCIASVDMRRMTKILWLDEENLQACIEAGISGKEMERELNSKGFTSGHDPDSIEFSTLGGWISTNASGMKKNKYGNIEEIVLEATLVTPTGEIEARSATPRNSVGIPPKVFLFGSEGNFGIITKAIIKIHPLPEIRRYGSLIFPSLRHGIDFLKELRRVGAIPASIRLVSNVEFRFGQALKPAPGFFKGITTGIQKLFLFKIMRYRPLEITASTIVMEGSEREVEHQAETLFATAKTFKGISGGSGNGRRGYMLTFGIAYIRDFLSQFQVLGETFETSVPWDRIEPVCQAVQDELISQCRTYNVPGKPYLAYRLTQTYHTGVCIYFTMGFCGKGIEKSYEVYHNIERALRQVILDNGGSLSHHHGIGKIRRGFLPQIQTENSVRVQRDLKRSMDPNNVFAIGNGPFSTS